MSEISKLLFNYLYTIFLYMKPDSNNFIKLYMVNTYMKQLVLMFSIASGWQIVLLIKNNQQWSHIKQTKAIEAMISITHKSVKWTLLKKKSI